MATRLTNLKIKKVDFVDQGANQEANILLFKRKEGAPPPPEQPPEDTGETLLKRILCAVAKALGLDGEQPPSAPSDPEPAEPTSQNEQGAVDMKFDKSKMPPEERAALEALEKKYGLAENQEPPANTPPASDPPTDDDIYKGLHPAIKAELENLRKMAQAAEDKELAATAKKYEIIGKKAEELVPLFKTLKAAGGDAYDQMIAVLDASVEAFEKSGLFKELGKGGSGQPDAWDAIEKHAADIQKAAPAMNYYEAVAKACEQHPELVREYEASRQGGSIL